jgi:hypothetical protein
MRATRASKGLLAVFLCLIALTPATATAKIWNNSQLRLPNSTHLAEITGDGIHEYVQATGATIFVYKVDLKPTLLSQVTAPANVTKLFTGNFANLGRDLVCAYLADATTRCYQFATSGTSVTELFSQTGVLGSNDETMTGNFDGDATDELLVFTPSSGALRMFKKSSTGGFAPLANFSFGDLVAANAINKHLRIGNFGGTSTQSDVLLWSPQDERISVYLTTTTSGQTRLTLSFTTNANFVTVDEEVAVPNLDGDATEDVALHNKVTGAYRFFRATNAGGVLTPITNVTLGALDTSPNTRTYWGRFFAPGTDALPLRDDGMVYSLDTRAVSLSDAQYTGSQRTYVGATKEYVPWIAPYLPAWLAANTAVASSIKWQTVDACYSVPETSKVAWPSWTGVEYGELNYQFEVAWQWYFQTAFPMATLNENIVYPPVNQSGTVSDDNARPSVGVTTTYARQLYVAWVAHNLLVEIGQLVPWSLASLDAVGRSALLDSSTYMKRCSGQGGFMMGASYPEHPNYVKREDNVGSSLIAPPRWTLAWMKALDLVGSSRLDTIVRVLNWSGDNLIHFIGQGPNSGFNNKNFQDHWQYRGLPPITKIAFGTTSPYWPNFGHWTAGCHGSVAFYRDLLRAVNVPMQIARVCGHSQAVFPSEGLYMDHGDNPYNSTFQASGQSASALLIDQATYTARFGSNPDNHDGDATMCGYIGWETNH